MSSKWYPLLLLALAACPGRLENPDQFLECQLDVEQDIFKKKCGSAGCHGSDKPANDLDLVTTGIVTRLKTTTSKCQNKSYPVFMMEKLGSTPSCGDPMPIGLPLSATEKKCVKEYLDDLSGKDGGA